MTELPAPLAPWRKELALFPAELAAALGRLVQALAPALHSLARPFATFEGEVDGIDGVANRGSFERLLPSEWALNAPYPLEFLRRAVAGEQAFFNLARRSPRERQGTLLLLDAGPDQIGACRLVQLAVLVILTQRAEERRETLEWQLLHHLGETPRSSLTQESVRAFLAARTGLRSSPAAFVSWRERYPGLRHWLVAAPELTARCEGCTSVSVAERVTPESGFVDVVMRAPGHSTRERVLELPPPAVATRLVRDPFAVPRPPESALRAPGIASNLLFTPQGSRIFYRAPSGELVGLPVPNSPRASPGNPRRYPVPAGARVIAAAGRGRHTAWLATTGPTLTFSRSPPKPGNRPVTLSVEPPLGDGGDLWPLLDSVDGMLTFVAPDRSLWRADLRSGVARPIGSGVQCVLVTLEARWVVLDDFQDRSAPRGPALLKVHPFTVERLELPPAASGGERGRVFLRRPGAGSLVFGYEVEPSAWHVEVRSQERVVSSVILRPHSEARVVGIDDGRGIFLLDGSRTELVWIRRHASQTLLRSTSPITDVTVAGRTALLAYATASGELGVIDMKGRHRLRGRLEGGPA